MGNGKIRKTFFSAVFFFLFIPWAIFSLEENPWTIAPSMGIHWGETREIFHDISGQTNSNPYVSLLVWELNPTITVGVDVRGDFGRLGALSLGFNSAIPSLPSGEMNDFDWFYTDRDWSHWSMSDLTLRWGFLADLAYDWPVTQKNFFELRLGISYHLDTWAWTDNNQDSVYSTTNGTSYPGPFASYPSDGFRDLLDFVPVGVNGIDYSVAYHAALAKISIGLQWKRLTLDMVGRAGPALVSSHDHHKLRTSNGNTEGLHFYFLSFVVPWIDFSVLLGLQSKKNFSLQVGADYAWSSETKGNRYVEYTNGNQMVDYGISGSASFRRLSLLLKASWKL